MKKQHFKIFAVSFLFAIIVIISTTSAFAQTGKAMKVEIPFDFYVASENFSAGKYNVLQLTNGAFLIRSADGSRQIIAPTPPTFRIKQPQKMEKLVFNRYGSSYFLRQVFSNRLTEGYGLFESKAEKSARQDFSKNTARKPQTAQVTVLMETN